MNKEWIKRNPGNGNILCPYCEMPTEWVENREIYGKNYGKSYMMWLCRDYDDGLCYKCGSQMINYTTCSECGDNQ